jgi:hypothetical protein
MTDFKPVLLHPEEHENYMVRRIVELWQKIIEENSKSPTNDEADIRSVVADREQQHASAFVYGGAELASRPVD